MHGLRHISGVGKAGSAADYPKQTVLSLSPRRWNITGLESAQGSDPAVHAVCAPRKGLSE